MLCKNDGNDYGKIGYLLSINQSPPSHDTVLELLTQSKLAAQKLGLNETDVALDMAFFSKQLKS